MKKLVIIGASDLQNPLILKARQMGYETHVFAWKCGDIGERTADCFYPISIVEKEEILSKCRGIKPAGVVTIASDLAAITVNYVANQLGLPANPPETAYIATNKYAMRQAFRENGVMTPAFMKVGPQDDPSAVYAMKLPIIVKPTDRSGSRGIFKLTSFDGLQTCIADSAKLSFEGKAIVEEYIEGNEYSCECISQHGRHHMLAITKKYTTGAPHFIETGHIEPSGLSENIVARVQENVFKALDALRITTGASHSEFKVLPGTEEIRLIEIGARMGGDCIGSDLVQLSTGADFVQMVIDAAVGNEITLTRGDHASFAAVKYLLDQRDYERYARAKESGNESIVRESGISQADGAVTDSSTRHGFYIVTAESIQRICELTGMSYE